MLGYKQMVPGDRLDFDIDFADWIPDGDSISAVTTAVDLPDEIEVDETEINGSTVKVWVNAPTDTANATYEVKVKITTTEGRTKTVCFKVRVRDC